MSGQIKFHHVCVQVRGYCNRILNYRAPDVQNPEQIETEVKKQGNYLDLKGTDKEQRADLTQSLHLNEKCNYLC